MDTLNMLAQFVSTEPVLQAKAMTTEASNTVGAMYCGDLSYDWYHHYWQPDIINHYYPSYSYPVIVREDIYQKAFSIAKMLLQEKLLVGTRVVDFIALVDKIASKL